MGGHILVVDDDASIRECILVALELEGYDVEFARNGKEALDRLQGDETPPCLVLLDVAMPVMTGDELLRHIRADARLRELPVVVLTALGARASSRSAGATEFLAKPVALDDLLGVAIRHCPHVPGR